MLAGMSCMCFDVRKQVLALVTRSHACFRCLLPQVRACYKDARCGRTRMCHAVCR